MRTLPALLAVALLAPASRAGDGAEFEKHVRPILTEHCVRCHGPERQRGGLRVDSREHLLTGGDTGPALVPGKADESLLVKAVRHEDGVEMPPNGKLTDAQVAALAKWVAGGAVWSGGKSAEGKAAKYKPGRIGDEERAWWAFQPVKRPAVPAAGRGWSLNPIDHFVAERLASAGLSPAPAADRRALVRRVTFDLIALPPTPAETDAFVKDASPDAYEKLIDRLLARPEYGERWARHWLDLVRYADSDGYRLDAFRPHAWPYRDYVIRSFNADKPYDRFVKEQLAGDELYPGDPDALRATGYLRLWSYEYNQRDVRGQFAAILNDVTDVTGDVFLGLGMGCARCHDHKFDPLLQKDYYRLQAFFANLDFRDEPVFDAAGERAEYESRLAEWESRTAAVRAKVDELLRPVREKEMKGAARKFPDDIEAIFLKPADRRQPRERQLYDLAYRQVRYEFDRADTKLSKEKKAEYADLKKELDALGERPREPLAMLARDLGPAASETTVPGKSGPAVEPGLLTILDPSPAAVAPLPNSTGRRAALANWLARPDNPLSTRVVVNRVWQHHFGKGLVATPSDFGRLGEKPSHPELLDWLTAEFVERGWSLKQLHRLILTSAAYRQSSARPDASAGRLKDPENRLLWKHPVRRLDAEQVRDAMLAVSGELSPREGGPAADAAKPVRSVYTKVLRNTRDPILDAFDAADGLTSCACRNVTTTPTQSLLLLNGAETAARSKAFAKRLLDRNIDDVGERVRVAYRTAYGREPAAGEVDEARAFLKGQAEKAGGKPLPKGGGFAPEARLAAWADFCHVLLNSSEFLYVD